MTGSKLDIKQDGNRIRIYGALDLYNFYQAKEELQKAHNVKDKTLIIDLSELTRLDTAGALLLHNVEKEHLQLTNLRPEYKSLFDLVSKVTIKKVAIKKPWSSCRRAVIRIGIATTNIYLSAVEFTSFMGRSCLALIYQLIASLNSRFDAKIYITK